MFKLISGFPSDLVNELIIRIANVCEFAKKNCKRMVAYFSIKKSDKICAEYITKKTSQLHTSGY